MVPEHAGISACFAVYRQIFKKLVLHFIVLVLKVPGFCQHGFDVFQRNSLSKLQKLVRIHPRSFNFLWPQTQSATEIVLGKFLTRVVIHEYMHV